MRPTKLVADGMAKPRSAKNHSASERARVLLELLKDQKADQEFAPLLKDARRNVGKSEADRQEPAQADLRGSARELLDRIGRKSSPPAPRSTGAMPPHIVRSTIAALIDGNRLAAEHPAVIAMVIENQPRSMQSAVLRGLTGRLARQVRLVLISR